MIVVWREWFNEPAVKKMTEMGTLPREEMELAIDGLMDGSDVAAEIARQANKEDFEAFQEGGKIVILEPEYVAGTFDISVEFEPRFSAYAVALLCCRRLLDWRFNFHSDISDKRGSHDDE